MKAVFLDRDGTIIQEVPPEENTTFVRNITFFPDTVAALKLLQAHGFAIIIVSNQPAVNEGLITLEAFHHQNHELIEAPLLSKGVRITMTYVCPHTENEQCSCAKPKPGMILEAATTYDIDLPKTYMVGDRSTDVQAGITAGTKTILVRTGTQAVAASNATYTAKNLLEAAQYIIDHPV